MKKNLLVLLQEKNGKYRYPQYLIHDLINILVIKQLMIKHFRKNETIFFSITHRKTFFLIYNVIDRLKKTLNRQKWHQYNVMAVYLMCSQESNSCCCDIKHFKVKHICQYGEVNWALHCCENQFISHSLVQRVNQSHDFKSLSIGNLSTPISILIKQEKVLYEDF